MAIEQLNAELATQRLAAVVSAAEGVCSDRPEMIATFVCAIATLATATPCCGDKMLEIAIEMLTKARGVLAESQRAMALAVEARKAGAS